MDRYRISAYGLISRDEKVLLCRIAPHVTAAAGKWTLPGGGLRFGEDPASALRREVFEETGLSVEEAIIMHVDSELFEEDASRLHVLRLLYRVRAGDGELTDEVDGSTDLCRWFTPEEAKAIPLVPTARLGLELLLRG